MSEILERMKLTLFLDRVLVLPDGGPKETKSGILLSAKASQDNVARGVVHLVGPDVIKLKESDQVLYGSFSGVTLKLDGEEYLMLHEDDILAKVAE